MKFILPLLFISIFILSGCESKEQKYSECLKACGKGETCSTLRGEEICYKTNGNRECINICVKKYK